MRTYFQYCTTRWGHVGTKLNFKSHVDFPMFFRIILFGNTEMQIDDDDDDDSLSDFSSVPQVMSRYASVNMIEIFIKTESLTQNDRSNFASSTGQSAMGNFSQLVNENAELHQEIPSCSANINVAVEEVVNKSNKDTMDAREMGISVSLEEPDSDYVGVGTSRDQEDSKNDCEAGNMSFMKPGQGNLLVDTYDIPSSSTPARARASCKYGGTVLLKIKTLCYKKGNYSRVKII